MPQHFMQPATKQNKSAGHLWHQMVVERRVNNEIFLDADKITIKVPAYAQKLQKPIQEQVGLICSMQPYTLCWIWVNVINCTSNI